MIASQLHSRVSWAGTRLSIAPGAICAMRAAGQRIGRAVRGFRANLREGRERAALLTMADHTLRDAGVFRHGDLEDQVRNRLSRRNGS